MTEKLSILIIDDDPITQLVVAEELEAGGSHGHYRFILMDCQMPLMDGFTCTQEIRLWEKSQGAIRTPIVALTGHTHEAEKARAFSSGMDGFIAKPFTEDDRARLLEAYPSPDDRFQGGVRAEVDLTPGVRRSRRLMELFLQHVPGQLAELRDAQLRGVALEVRACAHKLKGSCLAIDAPPMAQAAEALQRQADAGDLSGADALVSELEARFLRVKSLIVELLTP